LFPGFSLTPPHICALGRFGGVYLESVAFFFCICLLETCFQSSHLIHLVWKPPFQQPFTNFLACFGLSIESPARVTLSLSSTYYFFPFFAPSAGPTPGKSQDEMEFDSPHFFFSLPPFDATTGRETRFGVLGALSSPIAFSETPQLFLSVAFRS